MRDICKVAFFATIIVAINTRSDGRDVVFTAPPPEEPAVASVPASDAPRVREQWRSLAPYLSMHGEIALERLTPESAVRKFESIRNLSSEKFDAHPDLEAVGQPLMVYLAASEARIVPTLEVEWESVEMDNLLEAAMMQFVASMWENHVLLAWQTEYDNRLRTDYTRMLPLARALGGEVRDPKETISFECKRGALLVVNRSGMTLRNVTLATSLTAFGGRESPHYFFISSWSSDEPYQLRLSTDWQPIGGEYTTGAIIEVVADQLRTEPTQFILAENAERGPELFLRQIGSNIKSRPSFAIAQLNRFKKQVDPRSSLRAEADALQREARIELKRVVDGIDAQVRKLEADKVQLQRRIPKMSNENQKKHARDQIKRITAKVKQLKSKKADMSRESREV